MEKKNQIIEAAKSGFMYGAGYALGWYLMTCACNAIEDWRMAKERRKAEG